jgi:tRNA pseudouridine38-40 synthase
VNLNLPAPNTTRIRLLVAYDGTDFCGWQRQSTTGTPSIQETLEKALSKIYDAPINCSAAGRTDAGVHALGQVAHFDAPRLMKTDLPWALRSVLPPSVAVKEAWIAPPEFHATLSATKKNYRYLVYNAPRVNPILGRYSYWVRDPQDIAYLNQTASYLIGTHDFKSFQSAGTPVRSTVRTIYHAEWRRVFHSNVLLFSVTGDGFLKQMVRNVVGTMLDLAKYGCDPQEMKRIIGEQNRTKAGPTAPPEGLFMRKVYYPLDLDRQCRKFYNDKS